MDESLAPSMHEQRGASVQGPGPLARLVAFIITAGLAWAIAIAVCAWLLGLVFARG